MARHPSAPTGALLADRDEAACNTSINLKE
jgi:hypothetical protein